LLVGMARPLIILLSFFFKENDIIVILYRFC
jgi:hypothetical protein